MILSELIGAPVTAGADRLGCVVDVRFELAAESHVPNWVGTARLHGLIVSPRSSGSFRGYERTGVDRPVLIARWLAWRGRGSFLVIWEDIAVLESGRVELRPGFTRHSTDLRK